MARIRTLKPEFWTHEGLSALPEATHLLAAALLNYADDHGYFNANPKLVQAACSPIREPSVSIPESFRSLQTVGYLRLGTTPDGRRWGRITHFAEHQRVSHPTASKIASESISWDSENDPPEIFRNPPEIFAPEGNREQGTGNGEERCAPPAKIPEKPSTLGLSELSALGISEQHARDWLLARKAKRAGPVTETAMAAMRREAAKAGITLDEAVRVSAERGWQSFRSDWDWQSRAGPTSAPQARLLPLDPYPEKSP